MASTKAETKQSTGKRPYEASSEELQDETVSVKRTCLETEVNGENSATEPSAVASLPGTLTDAYGVPGLVYIPNFITPAEEAALIEAIDAGTWDTSLKRRVQHFGLRYDYTSKSVDKNAKLDPLPDFFSPLVQKVDVLTLFERSPEQCIVNEYNPGQGISPHTDRPQSFGPVVASISLGSDAIMCFQRDKRNVDVLLERRSIVILTGTSRYKWKHSIAPRKIDEWKGATIERQRRVSVTFRTINRDRSSE